MQKLQTLVSSILDKMDLLLTTEPARVIGYGAAGIVYLAARILADRGYIEVRLSFDQSIGAAFGAVTTLVILIESIRRFVYSPQTYIEDLADESEAAHEAAHIEEDLARWAEVAKGRAAQAAQPKTQTVSVGTAKASGTGDKAN